jgi:SAM-dependent methyltransferase
VRFAIRIDSTVPMSGSSIARGRVSTRHNGGVTNDPASPEAITWHHGLVARWWSTKVATAQELDFYGGAIRRFGEPALDLACGTGRLLVRLLEAGLDVDGVDVSEDMLTWCRRRADDAGVSPTLRRQAMHELDLPRRYRTIFVCDSFGIGGSRANDREGLRRIHDHLEPGGALVFSTGYPWGDEEEWLLWLPRRRANLPDAWPDPLPGQQDLGAGEILEQGVRLVAFDPQRQRIVKGIRDRLVRDGQVIVEEQREIAIELYFEQELRLILELAGFVDVEIQSGYTGQPATADDADTVVIARRAASS